MELITAYRVVRRWWWLILSLVLVTAVAMGLRLQMAAPVYQGQVKLRFTIPQQEDVQLYDQYRSVSLRGEITIARNNFVEIMRSRVVRRRVADQLDLQGADARYDLDVQASRDSEFLYLTVHARTPKLAEEIANTHVSTAINYYGEVLAKPATAAKDFLEKQLQIAENEFESAEAALTRFQTENGIGALDDELTSYNRLIEHLQLERNRRMLEGPTSRDIQTTEKLLDQLKLERERAYAEADTDVMNRFDKAIDRYTKELEQLTEDTSATAHVDKLIAKRRKEMERLVALGPTYNILHENVRQAREGYQLLLNKYTEAVLKENTARNAPFVQVIEPAVAATSAQPVPTRLRALLVVAVAGSLGLGILLAFVLEYLTTVSTTPATAREPSVVASE
ncbi:MAG: hypothetical protein D6791_19010 [Chloroflexi bacterium]|nr:MAG: hypothetical protein D6791_19010 [Chloroflexota bacterium]